jgi:hypothetical protein
LLRCLMRSVRITAKVFSEFQFYQAFNPYSSAFIRG